MSTIPIDDKLVIGPDRANIDARYKASNNRPYTSVAAAEAAINLVIGNVGLTVLVADENDPDYPEAKEYWVQPYDNNGVTAYHLVEKGAGTTDYAELDNKPTISDGGQGSTQIPLSGNVKVTATAAASGQTTGVAVTAENGGITMAFTLEKGADGVNGTNGTNGTNGIDGKSAFEVWKETTGRTTATEAEYIADLQTKVAKWIPVAYEATAASATIGDTVTFTTAPSNPIDGAIVIMPNAASSATATMMFAVSEDPNTQGSYIYTYIGDLSVDTTGLLGISDVDGTGLANPLPNALAKATDVMRLSAKLNGISAKEDDASFSIIQTPGYYREDNGVVSWFNSSSGIISGIINITGYKYARFLGFVKTNNSTQPAIVFVQMDANNNVLYYEHYIADTSSGGKKEYKTNIVSGATKLVCVVQTDNFPMQDFYCYIGKGQPAATITPKTVVRKIDVGLYEFPYHATISNRWYASGNDKTASIPVKGGDIVNFEVGDVGTSDSALSGYAFLKDHVNNANRPIGFVNGYGVIPVTSNTEYEIVVPEGCTNIAFFETYAGITLVELLSVEIESIEEQEAVRLLEVQSVEERTGVYTMSGDFNSSSSATSIYYAVDDGKKYCVTCRVGYKVPVEANDRVTYVTYLASDMQTVLGHDAQIIGKGYNYYPDRKRLELPIGTKYIVLVKSPANVKQGLFEILDDDVVVVDAINYIETSINEAFFGITVSGSENVATSRLSAWGFRLPKSYDKYASPYPIVAMLHGAHGYVDATVLGYDTNYWKAWQNAYLDAGFVVLDVNGYGVYSDDQDTALHGGCPMAIETLKKALEYMKAHYNVMPKLFLHGSSMGTHLAQHYIKVYPEDVISVGLFAPVWIVYSILRDSISQEGRDKYAKAWGYNDYAAMSADDFEHFYGYVPLCNCFKIEKLTSLPSINKVGGAMMHDLIAASPDYTYIEKAAVPIRIWGGTSDPTSPRALYKALYNAYFNGGSNISLREIEGAGHDFCTSASNIFVRGEAIEFFRRSL